MSPDAERWVDEVLVSMKSSYDSYNILSRVGRRSLAGNEGGQEVLEV